MGKYTPYTFKYEGLNPDYNYKAYDVWGNFKPVSGSCNDRTGEATTSEFPFVQQQDKDLQDDYASAWTLTSIHLPSNGLLEIKYETDDYSHVQDKSVMEMFKVQGAGNDPVPTNGPNDNRLYDGADDLISSTLNCMKE